MTNPIIKIIAADGSETERPMTDEETVQLATLRAEWNEAAKAEEEIVALKAQVLDKLGLTAEEVAALLA